MRNNLIIATMMVGATLCGCNEWAGEPITQELNINGTYSELQVEDAFDVEISDAVNTITVTVAENVMPNVVVEKKGSRLKIYLKGWATNRGTDMKVLLPINPDLKKVELSGASDFYGNISAEHIEVLLSGASDFHGDIEGDKVQLELTGSSDLKGGIDAKELYLNMSGSSEALLEGHVDELRMNLSGASDIVKRKVGNRYALSCELCEGSMSGSSDAYIHCDGSIKVNLSGSSDLHYSGNAYTSCNATGSSGLFHDIL